MMRMLVGLQAMVLPKSQTIELMFYFSVVIDYIEHLLSMPLYLCSSVQFS